MTSRSPSGLTDKRTRKWQPLNVHKTESVNEVCYLVQGLRHFSHTLSPKYILQFVYFSHVSETLRLSSPASSQICNQNHL